MIKAYSIHSIPTGVQPKAYALEWLRKVLDYAQCKETEEDYTMKIKNGNGHRVFFTLKEGK